MNESDSILFLCIKNAYKLNIFLVYFKIISLIYTMFCCPIFRKNKEQSNYNHDDDELYSDSAKNVIPFQEDVNNITLDLVENTKQNLNNDLEYFKEELNKETNQLIDISNEIEESVETLVDDTQQHVEDTVEKIEDIKQSTQQHVEETLDELDEKYFKNKNSHLKTITELNEQEDYVHSREEEFDSQNLDDTEKSYYSEVTTHHCDLCRALIFYKKYDKVVSRRCEKCLLKYIN